MGMRLYALSLVTACVLYGHGAVSKSSEQCKDEQEETQKKQQSSENTDSTQQALSEAIQKLNAQSSPNITEATNFHFNANLSISGISARRRDVQVQFDNCGSFFSKDGRKLYFLWDRRISVGDQTFSSTFGVKGFFFFRVSADVPFGQVYLDSALSLDAHVSKKNKPLPVVLYVCIQSMLGDVNIGQVNGAIGRMWQCGSTPLVGLGGPASGRLDSVCAIYDVCGNEINYEGGIESSSTAPKLVWISPTIYGMKLGLSYAPDSKRMGFMRDSEDEKSVHAKNVVDVAASYTYGVPGKSGFRIMGGYRYGESSQDSYSNLHAYHVGCSFFANDFTIALGFSDNLCSLRYKDMIKAFKSAIKGEKFSNSKSLTVGTSYSANNIKGSVGYMYTFGWNCQKDSDQRATNGLNCEDQVTVMTVDHFAVKTGTHVLTVALQYQLMKNISISIEYDFICSNSKKVFHYACDHEENINNNNIHNYKTLVYDEKALQKDVVQRYANLRTNNNICSSSLRRSFGHVIDIGMKFSVEK